MPGSHGCARDHLAPETKESTTFLAEHITLQKPFTAGIRVRSAEIIMQFFWAIVLPTEKNRPEALKLIVVFGRRIGERISRLFPLNGPLAS